MSDLFYDWWKKNGKPSRDKSIFIHEQQGRPLNLKDYDIRKLVKKYKKTKDSDSPRVNKTNSEKKEKNVKKQNVTLENTETIILDALKKKKTLSDVSKIINCPNKVAKAYIEELIEQGYNIVQFKDFYKLDKIIVPEEKEYKSKWEGEEVLTFGVVSDTHLCSKYYQSNFLNKFYDILEKREIKIVYHCGDLSEGYYKNRPAHIYELINGGIGFDDQSEYIIKHYPKRKGLTTKFITGNHDHTHVMNGGANIGKIVNSAREDMEYLGHDRAVINLTPNCRMLIRHPSDGSAYAYSYKAQKLIESFTGGKKPNIVLNGHYHKLLYLFTRNVHYIGAGSFQDQTPFQEGKNLEAHVGGWIITLNIDKKGSINKIIPEMYPLYELE